MLSTATATGQGTRVTPQSVAPGGHACVRHRSSHAMRAGPNEYMGSDGRRKSTIEEAFQVKYSGDTTAMTEGREPPWGIGWQTAERNLAWNDELKQRLIKVLFCVLTHNRPQGTLSGARSSHQVTAHAMCNAACGC